MPWTAKARSLDILVQPRRDRKAALKLMRKLLKKQGVTPATIVTDKLILQLCAARTWCCAAARHRSLEE
jgi:putative transposase